MPVDSEAASIGLHLAARDGHVKVVRALLARRHPAIDIEEKDPLGDTALLKAARYGQLDVVNALLEAGANLRARDNKGWGCLHCSVSNNHKEVFLVLLSGINVPPADIEAKTSTGDTPLHMAAYHNRKWAVDTLLCLGGECFTRNDEGNLPHQVARHEDVRDLLLEAAARRYAAEGTDSEGPSDNRHGIGQDGSHFGERATCSGSKWGIDLTYSKSISSSEHFGAGSGSSSDSPRGSSHGSCEHRDSFEEGSSSDDYEID